MKKRFLPVIIIAALAVAAFAQERPMPPPPVRPVPPQGVPARPGEPPAVPQAQAGPAVQNAAGAVQNAPGTEEKTEEKIEKQVYIYNPAGRRDPFLSIIVASKEALKKRPKAKFVTPIEDFDLSQFKLIAVVMEGAEKYALVSLPDGKHYTIREGMRVGLNEGKVTRILSDKLIVREFVKDYRGQLAPKDTTLKLRTEEEGNK